MKEELFILHRKIITGSKTEHFKGTHCRLYMRHERVGNKGDCPPPNKI